MEGLAAYLSGDEEVEEEIPVNSDTDAVEVGQKRSCPSPPCISNGETTAGDKRAKGSLDEYHQGRVRSFPHVEGNYPGFVYIECVSQEFDKAASEACKWAESAFSPRELIRIPVADLHLSLCRTFAARRNQIEPLVKNLRIRIARVCTFSAVFRGASLYANDERTRSFVGLNLVSGAEHAKQLVEGVDAALHKFAFPPYYKDPSFHVSVAWSLGGLPESILQQPEDCASAMAAVRVRNVLARIGAYTYTFPLKV